MHKSCIYIQKAIYLAPYEVRACCQRFFVDGKMKGDVALVTLEDPRDIEYSEIIEAKKKLIEGINNGTDDRCAGCFALKERDWDNIEDEELNSISVENHSLCNMKCSYCSDVYYGGVEPQYSLEHLFEGLNDVGDDLHIAWGGGEPTVRKDFNDLFLSLNEKFHPKTQRVFTNALKYSRVLQEALDSRSTSITTSIDAGVEDTFRKVRDSKGLDKVLQFLERYSKNSPDLITIKYIFTVDNYDDYNLVQFVKRIQEHNLTKCNYLISADFNYETLEDEIIFSIISLYFRLHTAGVYAVTFDDHIFHKVRMIGKDVSSYINNLEVVGGQGKIVKDAIDSFSEKNSNNVIIWGTGEFSKYLFDTAEEDSYVVSGIVDGMEEKWGSAFMGFEVQSPQSLVDNKSDIIIASVNFYGEIFNKLISIGVSRDRIIPNFLL
jgi:poly(ribitol-phosphate) beta-N-acetylglucosaminyltransferase